jgi:hypothetical protein
MRLVITNPDETTMIGNDAADNGQTKAGTTFFG